MKTAALGALVLEARNVVRALQDERKVASVGPVVVSGMLAEQLARELGAGASAGAVALSDEPRISRAPVAVRVIAGDPSPEDDTFVRHAERAEIPVVLVQLWPQANWRAPFVLSPFVVECKTGEGFPVRKIAERIATAADDPIPLAARIPVLKDPVERLVKRGAVVRSAILGATVGRKKEAARPLLALEQVGLIARLRSLEAPEASRDEQLPIVAGTAAATIAASFGLREVARAARRRLPPGLVDAAVAGGGTWALAELARRLQRPRS